MVMEYQSHYKDQGRSGVWWRTQSASPSSSNSSTRGFGSVIRVTRKWHHEYPVVVSTGGAPGLQRYKNILYRDEKTRTHHVYILLTLYKYVFTIASPFFALFHSSLLFAAFPLIYFLTNLFQTPLKQSLATINKTASFTWQRWRWRQSLQKP